MIETVNKTYYHKWSCYTRFKAWNRITLLLFAEESNSQSAVLISVGRSLYAVAICFSFEKHNSYLSLCLLSLSGTCYKVSESGSGLEQWMPCMKKSMTTVVLTAVSMR